MTLETCPIGTRIQLADERNPYTLRARGARYLICTKPGPKNTTRSTLIDLTTTEHTRSTDTPGAVTDEACLELLASAPSNTSRRVPLQIVALYTPAP